MTTTRPHPTRTLLVLGLPALAYSLAQTMLVPAFSEMVRALHSTPATVTWVLTAYLVSAAVFTPVLGRLGDMFGKRKILVVAVAAFALGNVLSAVGNDVGLVIAGRVVQGIAGGMFPLFFGIIRDELSPERVGGGIGVVSATLGIGGGAGLLLGGAMVDAFGYTSIFWLGAITSALSVVAIRAWVPESRVRVPGRVDLRGAAVLGIGLAVPLLGVSESRTWGWTDPRTLALVLGGVLVLVAWVQLERRTADPLVDIATLARPAVLLTNLATLLVGFGMFGAYVLVPQLVEAPTSTGYGFGATATHAGLLMLPGSLSMLLFGPLSGVVGARWGHRAALVLGAVLSAAGLGLLAAFHGSDGSILAWFFVLTAGIGFAFAAMPNLIVSSVSASQTGQATGFNAVVRSVGSSVGTQVTAVVVATSAAAGTALPRDSGYVHAFALCGAVAGAAAVLAAFVPGSRGGHLPFGDEMGAASLLPDPAFAADPV